MQAKLDDPKKLVLMCEHHKVEEMIKKRKLDEAVLAAGFHENPFLGTKIQVVSFFLLIEGMPNILLEGLALGVPIASTDCPSGPNEILQVTVILIFLLLPETLSSWLCQYTKALHSREAIPSQS